MAALYDLKLEAGVCWGSWWSWLDSFSTWYGTFNLGCDVCTSCSPIWLCHYSATNGFQLYMPHG